MACYVLVHDVIDILFFLFPSPTTTPHLITPHISHS